MPEELLAQIAELLGLKAKDLAETTLEDIAELLGARFEELAVVEDTDIVVLETVVEAIKSVKAEITAAESAEADRLAKIEALRAEVAPKDETPAEEVPADEMTDEDEGDDNDAAPAGDGEPEASEAAAPEVVVEDERVPVAASAPARVALPRRRPASHAPVPVASGPRQLSAVVAAGDIPGYSAGSAIPTWEDLGHAFADKADMLDSGQTAKIARMRWEYDEARSLTASNEAVNTARLRDVVGQHVGIDLKPLVAAGGLCAPAQPIYEQEVYGVADRPVRDSMPRFGATRGGVVHVPVPVLSEVTGAVDIITADEDAADATKPCLTITCASPETVSIYAATACVQVGNFDKRTFPEHFEAFWTLAAAQHAREAESQLLDTIATGSTNVSDAQNLGAARDIIEALIRARATFISRHRMSPQATFRVGAPFWVRDLMRADLAREAPGSNVERLAMVDSQIQAMFTAAGYAPYWYLDTASGEGEVYGSQGAGALLGWQTTPKFYIYPEGTWVFLDGGMLDFGVEIRDSTLNTSNNVRAMFETFENAVRLGPESLELELALCVSGQASALEALTCPVVS